MGSYFLLFYLSLPFPECYPHPHLERQYAGNTLAEKKGKWADFSPISIKAIIPDDAFKYFHIYLYFIGRYKNRCAQSHIHYCLWAIHRYISHVCRYTAITNKWEHLPISLGKEAQYHENVN